MGAVGDARTALCRQPEGTSRSRSPELIVKDIEALEKAGFAEIVLTGIHLGRWQCDLGLNLDNLLDALDRAGDSRIRLSSIEPMDLSPEMVDRIISHPKICPHLHIPLQSADNGILKAMGRGHTIEQYSELIRAAKNADPDVSIGTDIMVGFPGEDDAAFYNTFDFLVSQPFAYIHVFTFSPRLGTRAWEMTDRVPGEIVKDRMRMLRKVGNEKRRAFRAGFAGRTLPCLIETPDEAGIFTALSHNYLRIRIARLPEGVRPGQVIPLIIDTNCNGMETCTD